MAPPWTEALLRLTLRGGSVYYLQHRSLTSPEPHYFAVLNTTPLGDHFLVLAVASSKVDAVRSRNRNLPPETLVEISPAEYKDFRAQSIIDCNHFFRVTKQELLQKLQTGVALEKSPFPADILSKLRRGMMASPVIEQEIKDLLK